jgi:hypothetical protein
MPLMEDAEALRAMCALPPAPAADAALDEIVAAWRALNTAHMRYQWLTMLDPETYPAEPYSQAVRDWSGPVWERVKALTAGMATEEKAALGARSRLTDVETDRIAGEVAARVMPRWTGRELRVMDYEYQCFHVHKIGVYAVTAAGHRAAGDDAVAGWLSYFEVYGRKCHPLPTPEAAALEEVRRLYAARKRTLEDLVPHKERRAGRTATPAREAPHVAGLNGWARAAELLGQPIEGHVYREPEWDNHRAPEPTGDAALAKALIAEGRKVLPPARAAEALRTIGLVQSMDVEERRAADWRERVERLPERYRWAVRDAVTMPPEAAAAVYEPYVGQVVRGDGHTSLVTPLGVFTYTLHDRADDHYYQAGMARWYAGVSGPGIRYGYNSGLGDTADEAERKVWWEVARGLRAAIRLSWSRTKKAAYERAADLAAERAGA